MALNSFGWFTHIVSQLKLRNEIREIIGLLFRSGVMSVGGKKGGGEF